MLAFYPFFILRFNRSISIPVKVIKVNLDKKRDQSIIFSECSCLGKKISYFKNMASKEKEIKMPTIRFDIFETCQTIFNLYSIIFKCLTHNLIHLIS